MPAPLPNTKPLPPGPRLSKTAVRTWVDVRCEQPGEASLSFALRTPNEGVLVQWEVALDPSFAQRERYGIVRAPQSGRICIALTGLTPGRMYWFRVQSEQLERGVTGVFRTLSHAAFRARSQRALAGASRGYVAITPA